MAQAGRQVSGKRDRLRSDARTTISKILDATLNLLGQGQGPNVEAVALETGVAPSTVSRHFATRNDLYEATLQYVLYQLRMRAAEAVSEASTAASPGAIVIDAVFDEVLPLKHALHNLLCSLSDAQLFLLLKRNQTLVTNELYTYFNGYAFANSSRDQNEFIDVVYTGMQSIFLDFIRTSPTPARQDAYKQLLKTSADLLANALMNRTGRSLINFGARRPA